MKNKLETLYAIKRSLIDNYDMYDECSDGEEKDWLQTWMSEKYSDLMSSINQEGKVFAYIFGAYTDSMKEGNEYINFKDNVNYNESDAPDIVACLRENEVEYFTFSSSWSSALDSAWKFTQCGCTIVGMTEITRLGNKEKALLFQIGKASQQTDEDKV